MLKLLCVTSCDLNFEYKIAQVTFHITINNSLCFREAVGELGKGQLLG